MGPIDYLGNMPPQELARNFQSGLQVGATIQALQQQQAAQQIAQQRAAQYQADVTAFQQSPTAQGALALSLKYPDQAKPITDAYGAFTGDQQKVALKDAATLTNLLHAGRDDLASTEIAQRIEAAKNSGLPTNELEALQSLVKTDPKSAYAHSLTIMAALPGGKDVLSNLQSVNKDARDQVESDTKVAGEQADNTVKNFGIVGQSAGALAKPGVKPAQVVTMFKSLEARGIIPKGGAQDYIDNMPADAAALPDYLKSVQAAGMKPDEQMKYTTPDANAQLSADTQRRGQNIAASTAAARLAFDKDQANAADGPDNTPEAEKKLWVHQYVAGNGSVPRSAPANVRSHIGTWAAEMGITPDDLSSGSAKAKFDQASAVTSGHRAGSMASVEATMPALTDNARQLAGELGQGRFVPVNKLLQMADENISDPKLAAFKVGHQAVVSEYQQVISRGGTNVTALREAMHALNSARGIDAYNAALKQVDKEVAINVAGTKAVRAGLGGNHGAAPAPSAATNHPADITALLKKYGGR